jgi:glutaredoxin 3
MEESRVEIFGKDTVPYTTAAREDYARRKIPFAYVDVRRDAKELERMVHLSGGRRVPVIVESGKVTIGFGGT